jgi:hypothetical protein|tara:strand:+ start:225 stop:419 length:195 start_codon:yes stop_codon:yes gene_type:complete
VNAPLSYALSSSSSSSFHPTTSLFSSHRWKGKCTDVFCLGLFALFWVGMGIVCIIGFSLGNTSR